MFEVRNGTRCRPTNSGYEFVGESPSVVSAESNDSGSNDSSQASRLKYQPLDQMSSWAEGIDLASYV